MYLNPGHANTENLRKAKKLVIQKSNYKHLQVFGKCYPRLQQSREKCVTFKILRFSNLNWMLGDTLDILLIIRGEEL